VLDAIGFTVHLVDGGYQAFRTQVRQALETLPARFEWQVLCGRTGSAKSRLLLALAEQGAQVIDLEALACHRGSVLGPLPGQPQPSQKAFDTALWHALSGLDPTRPVFIEGESRTVGRLRVPERLIEALRAAPVVQVQMALAARVVFLLDDYAHFVDDTEAFCARLQALRDHRGAAVVERWQQMARSGLPGALPAVVQELLEQHYDPVYERSMSRHFTHYAQARVLGLADATPASLQQAATALLAPARLTA
jgi:tRNA 2-selenouridine synthase